MACLSENDSGRHAPVRDVLIIEPASPSSLLQPALTRAGFRVQVANSTHLASVAVKKTCPDIVVIRGDIGPPGASELARRIKCDPESADLPVVLVDGEVHPPPFAYPTEARLAHDASEADIVSTLRMLTKKPRKVRYSGRKTSSLEGRLDTDDFPDVLQFLFTSRKTGRVVVVDGVGRRGSISIDDGSVVGATLDARFGVPAFSEMCFLKAGTFRFEPGALRSKGTMNEPGLELLLESARRKDMDDKEKERAAANPEVTVRVRISSPETIRAGRVTTSPSPRAPRGSALRAVALVLLGLVTGSLVARLTLDRPPETVLVDILSDPSGAHVFVDERAVGTTPVRDVAVAPGNRLIRLDREGSETTVELVAVTAEDEGRGLHFSLPASPPAPAVLRLRRLPSRAKVYVDGIRQMSARTELAPGSYRVDVEAAGFARWTEHVELEPAMHKTLDVDLRPRSAE